MAFFKDISEVFLYSLIELPKKFFLFLSALNALPHGLDPKGKLIRKQVNMALVAVVTMNCTSIGK